MYCYNCGKEVDDKAVICVHCGVELKKREELEEDTLENREPKTLLGVVFALFLGLIGLLIGVLIYPAGTVARKTFLKGCIITLLITFGVEILIGVGYALLISGLLL